MLPFLARALSARHAGLMQVVLVGDSTAPGWQALGGEVAAAYLPFAIVVPVTPGERQAALARHLPWIAPMTLRDGRATAYVCRDFTCREPVTDREALREVFRAR